MVIQEADGQLEINTQWECFFFSQVNRLTAQFSEYELSKWVFLVLVSDDETFIVDQSIVNVDDVRDSCRKRWILYLNASLEKLFHKH